MKITKGITLFTFIGVHISPISIEYSELNVKVNEFIIIPEKYLKNNDGIIVIGKTKFLVKEIIHDLMDNGNGNLINNTKIVLC
jgi:hypothetical protein